jgi:hypothetical protein
LAVWNAYVRDNGADGTRKPVGGRMFGNGIRPTTTPTRATAAEEVRVPTRSMDTLVTHALKKCNACAELRDSKTKAEANNQPCKKFPAVQRSLFGHLERSNLLGMEIIREKISRRSTNPFFPRWSRNINPPSRST